MLILRKTGEATFEPLKLAAKVATDPLSDGMYITVPWNVVEPETGKLNFEWLHATSKLLGAKKLYIHFVYKDFDGSPVAPEGVEETPHKIGATMAKVWEPEIGSQFIRATEHLMTELDGLPNVAGFDVSETAEGPLLVEYAKKKQLDIYNRDNMQAFIIELMTAMSDSSYAYFNINFWPKVDVLLDAALKLGLGISHPDAMARKDVDNNQKFKRFSRSLGIVSYAAVEDGMPAVEAWLKAYKPVIIVIQDTIAQTGVKSFKSIATKFRALK